MPTIDRRDFLRRAASAAAVPMSVSALVAACSDAEPFSPSVSAGNRGRGNGVSGPGGYGDLVDPKGDGILALPRGFQYRVFGATNDPMSDGNVTPIALDGMAALGWGGNRVRLLRNHEDRNGPGVAPPIASPNAYDPLAGGGVTTLEVGPDRKLIRDFVSLNGTIVNCAGGPTPWGSWLSCEESTEGTSEGWARTHGWVFDVSASAEGPVIPVPIVPMGRFRHEAVAVDPSTGIVYETEDNSFPPGSGLFRYIPDRPGDLLGGGRLQLAGVRGNPQFQLFQSFPLFTTFDVVWYDIADPNPDPNDQLSLSDRDAAVFDQGLQQGGAIFNRLEGCWFGDGKLFFHDTRGGAASRGQVWLYDPATEQLTLIFESPGTSVLDSPDNITVSPNGQVVMCEDGSGTQFMRGLTHDGQVFDIARNDLNDTEFAGATFSPDGHTLFVNVQGPTRGSASDGAGQGVTIAIWGPWEKGVL